MNYLEFFTTDNKSGWKCRSTKLNRNNPEIYNKIVEYIKSNDSLKDLLFVQQVYHFIYQLPEVPTCPECGNMTKFFDIKRGYQKFCSVKCSNKDENKIKTTKNTNIERYGVTNPLLNTEIKDKFESNNIKNFGHKNPFGSKKIQEKIQKTNELLYGKNPSFRKKRLVRTSKIEKKVCKSIKGEKFFYCGKEYDIIVGDDIFEIDGDYFHPTTIENLTLTQVGSIINDKEKTDLLFQTKYKLHKVHVSDLPKNITVNSLKNNTYQPIYTITPFTKIITKEYFKQFIEKKGKDKLIKYVNLLLKFIRTFQPEFPYIVYKENDIDFEDYIGNYDVGSIYNNDNKTFQNNSSVVGCGYLKNRFQSFWNSKYNGKKSPVEMWFDDDVMRKVISYRIGINNSNEVFDFSVKEIIKGISAIRGTVSFFKPIVATSIYDHYLTNKINPIVFDPCCGFGGRLLGFKSKYPNGKYIGLEPNIDTYNELKFLSSTFTDVCLYNVKLEDFDVNIDYDIAFTSIPYFDLETYSSSVSYDSFEDWKETFINKLLSYPRILINMSESLAEKLKLTDNIDSYLSNQSSHFNKNNNQKREVIVKLNFKK